MAPALRSTRRLLPARLGPLVVGIAVAASACVRPSGNGNSGTGGEPTTAGARDVEAAPPARGIAARYPGDVGMETDTDVVFVEQFEEAALSAVFSRWSEVRNGSAMAFSSDVPPGSPGARSLNIPWVGGGVSDGGHLYKQLRADIDDTLHVRYYIKYPASGKYQHTGIWMGGYSPALEWPDPQAGVKPNGDDRFSAAAEQNTLTGRFDHYNYWMGMHQSADGKYWGNLLLNDPKVQAKAGQWTCVEHMVKLNDPPAASNGEHAIWLDGVKVSHLGPGFPKGGWSGGIFTPDGRGRPFEGFRWRSDARLNLNWIWLQNYAPGDPAGFEGDMKFDHVVAAKSSIGCLTAPASTGAAGTPGPGAKPWPNEPAGFAPLNDQPWDALRRPAAATAVARALERMQALLFRTAEGQDGWMYRRRASSKDDDIVTDATAPFSPPHVLRIVFTPDMKENQEPGVHWIGLPAVREVYTGWWMKVSPDWTCSPAGCGKITFLFTKAPGGAYTGPVYTNLYHPSDNGSVGGPPYRIGVNTQWSPYGWKIWYPNRTTTWVDPGEWHRVEFHYRWEAEPGSSGDGLIRWWVDGVLNGEHANVHYPPSSFVELQYAPTLQDPPPAEQYMYVDHTHVSVRKGDGTASSRRGRDGGEEREREEGAE